MDEKYQDYWQVYDKHCKGEFESIRDSIDKLSQDFKDGHAVMFQKFDNLDTTIRGNGTDGVLATQAKQEVSISTLSGQMKAIIGIGSALFITIAGRYIWMLIDHLQNT